MNIGKHPTSNIQRPTSKGLFDLHIPKDENTISLSPEERAGVRGSVNPANSGWLPGVLSALCLLSSIGGVLCPPSHAAEIIPLAGEWRFEMDRADAGVREQWFERNLPDRIALPGVLQSQGYGDEISIHTPWVLSLYDKYWYLRADYQAYTNTGHVKVPFVCQPPRHYLGAAWYQRDLDVPEGWQGRRVVLFLERPHWESRVWLDDRLIGTNNSLCAPHEFDLGFVPAGKHRLSIRVDNRMIMPYRPDAHSVSDSLDSSWNGIIGKIELRSTTPVWIEGAQVFPEVATKSARIKVTIGNSSGRAGSGTLSSGRVSAPVTWTTNGGSAELELAFGPDAKLWDEFSPVLQHCTVRLKGSAADDSRDLVFGLRDFHAEGQDFIMNGRKTELRGTHDGGDFPLTGYPPTDVESWKHIIRVCQSWGLNHLRFHSWCPPEAAFEAADELGFYLQPECGMWNTISPGTPMERMLYEETDRILKAYGNHPSFVLLSPSNEPHGAWQRSLPKWVEHYNQVDSRHLYTTGTGWSLINSPGPVEGVDYLSVGRIGMGPVRGQAGWFGRDYERSVRGVNVPVLAHEVGQWCAYPNYDIIPKFTGYMRPGNYEIFHDSMKAHGLLGKDSDFAWASGRFQFECYKEEVEANLRTPGLAGFQLLDLHDYVGQGTALVGLLDTFWDARGYATPEEFRRFCNTTVPLARLHQRVFTTADNFDVEVEVAHYSANPMTDAQATWKVVDAKGHAVANGEWPAVTIPIGKNFVLGKVKVDLSKLAAPGAYRLVVNVGQASRLPPDGRDARPTFENDWTFWLYPAKKSDTVAADISVTRSWDEAAWHLAAGGKVLFLPENADLDWTCPPLADVPIFWNRLMNPRWGRMLGLWCDTNHPALAEFPTEPNCDWQWTQIVRGARPMNLDRFPAGLQPIVQAIDDWNRNWKLGVIFECKVGQGRLMVCLFDLTHDLQNRSVARQLRRSLLDYMTSPAFQPKTGVPADDFRNVLFDTQIMRQLGATAEGEGRSGAAIDGDPNTYWLSGGSGRGQSGTRYPHQLTINFPQPVAMNGIVFMPRQNDRNHLGDVKDFAIEASDDGERWREVMRGQLASTWSPQRVQFDRTITTAHLRFTALSGFADDTSAALAEIAVLYVGPKLAKAEPGTIEYQRSRSTSTDVDEGPGLPANATRTNSSPGRNP